MKKVLLISIFLIGCSGTGYVPESTPIDNEGETIIPPYGQYCLCRDNEQYKDLLMCKQTMELVTGYYKKRYDKLCDENNAIKANARD